MELKKAFGEVLQDLRKKADLSQEALAFECQLDRTYISMLERGLRQPSLKTIFEIAAALEIQPETIVKKVRVKSHRNYE